MTQREMIERGVMTLNELSKLVKDNEARAQFFGVKLKWYYRKDGSIVGQAWHENILQQEKVYTLEYAHMKHALMHLDFHLFLNLKKKQFDEIQALRVAEAQEEKLRQQAEYRKQNPNEWQKAAMKASGEL